MSDEKDNLICVVCCQHTANTNKKLIYAIGKCDHRVCYECSTRMRVLCKQNECPICRQMLDQVVFTLVKNSKFDDFDLDKCLYHNNNGIHFDDEYALDSYGKLLEHPCLKCHNRPPFKTIHDLSTHLRKEHELFFCDLCVENIKIFTNERKYYNRKELARHRKSGDPDERSYRGHPLCIFCDERYVDQDDLLLHLRREHFYCHFCDPPGLNQFYADYKELRDHFIAQHYLCKECDGQEEKFTNAFQSEIDLQAHITQIHSQNMSKSDLKKAKTLSLDLFISHRSGHLDNGQQNKRQMKREQQRRNNRNNDVKEDSESDEPSAPVIVQPPRPEDFPSLSGSSKAINIMNTNTSDSKKLSKSSKKSNSYSVYLNKSPKMNAMNDEEFPALSEHKGPVLRAPSAVAYNNLAKQTISRPQTSGQTVNVQRVNLIDSLFTPNEPTKSVQKFKKPSINNKEEFPSLPVMTKKKTVKSLAQNSDNKKIDWNTSTSSSHITNDSKNSKIESKKKNNISNNASNILLPTKDDFPVLATNNKMTNSVKQQPLPKSFSTTITKPKTTGPPPGLLPVNKKSNLSLSSVAEVFNNLNANDSLDNNFKEYYYINPIDFNDRNQSLVSEVQNVLSDSTKFLLFKEVSKQFRQSRINGNEYYEKCIDLFGRKNFITIFSELLVLLPDICKQNELLSAQQMEMKNSKGAIPKGSRLLVNWMSQEFVICHKCKQVLIIKDENHHKLAHEI
ncbi:E3 ubiquitin-protein ligase ZNF598-like [Oppia nitens]|uniref:E3 ubiquitin-protein ligase ZNF598-like n=1 Tax=Oppia nitens TaxID=1686743 RepID=UPI0023DCC831|nr:E3 ubiquitin-protein ligase ZNF598-like [Oppia nitens]